MNKQRIAMPLPMLFACVLTGCHLQLEILSPNEGAVLLPGQTFLVQFVAHGNSRPATYTCQLDSEPPVACASGHGVFGGLARGQHSMKVTATADGETVSQTTRFSVAQLPFKIVRPQDGQVVPSQDVSASFGVSIELASSMAGLVCVFDTQAPSACNDFAGNMGNYSYFRKGATLAEGAHTFSAWALDSGGNTIASDQVDFMVALAP